MWFVYIVRCKDDTLYTGITNNITARLNEHNTGTAGAKYTRGRRPVKLVYSEEYKAKSDAAKREYAIKTLSKKQKEELIASVK